MSNEIQPNVVSIGVAFPISRIQKNSCRSTIKAKTGGKNNTINLSGMKVMRQAMIIRAIRKVGI